MCSETDHNELSQNDLTGSCDAINFSKKMYSMDDSKKKKL